MSGRADGVMRRAGRVGRTYHVGVERRLDRTAGELLPVDAGEERLGLDLLCAVVAQALLRLPHQQLRREGMKKNTRPEMRLNTKGPGRARKRPLARAGPKGHWHGRALKATGPGGPCDGALPTKGALAWAGPKRPLARAGPGIERFLRKDHWHGWAEPEKATGAGGPWD